jgi:hypothetical protein
MLLSMHGVLLVLLVDVVELLELLIGWWLRRGMVVGYWLVIRLRSCNWGHHRCRSRGVDHVGGMVRGSSGACVRGMRSSSVVLEVSVVAVLLSHCVGVMLLLSDHCLVVVGLRSSLLLVDVRNREVVLEFTCLSESVLCRIALDSCECTLDLSLLLLFELIVHFVCFFLFAVLFQELNVQVVEALNPLLFGEWVFSVVITWEVQRYFSVGSRLFYIDRLFVDQSVDAGSDWKNDHEDSQE